MQLQELTIELLKLPLIVTRKSWVLKDSKARLQAFPERTSDATFQVGASVALINE